LALFYVCSLKFLFTLIFSDEIYGDGNSTFKITQKQTPILMAIYGAGFKAIYSLFFFMNRHALMSKDLLELTPAEQFHTKTKMYSFSIFVSFGLFSILLAWLPPLEKSGLSGMFYVSIGPALTIFYTFRGKRRRLLHQPQPSSIQ
jgi:hypothetical protein